MAAYKQIQNLDAAVPSDVDEDNFDKAFAHFRPAIQGSADFGKLLTKGELDEKSPYWNVRFAYPLIQLQSVKFCTRVLGNLFPEDVCEAYIKIIVTT
jgi:hypothetical protein